MGCITEQPALLDLESFKDQNFSGLQNSVLKLSKDYRKPFFLPPRCQLKALFFSGDSSSWQDQCFSLISYFFPHVLEFVFISIFNIIKILFVFGFSDKERDSKYPRFSPVPETLRDKNQAQEDTWMDRSYKQCCYTSTRDPVSEQQQKAKKEYKEE